MARTTISFDDEIDDYIQNRLVKGQSRTIWLDYAIETVYGIDKQLDPQFDPWEYDERSEFIQEAVEEKIERRSESS